MGNNSLLKVSHLKRELDRTMAYIEEIETHQRDREHQDDAPAGPPINAGNGI